MYKDYKPMSRIRKLQVRYWLWQHDRRVMLSRLTAQQKEERLQRTSGWVCIGIIIVLTLVLIVANVWRDLNAEETLLTVPAHTGKIT